MPEERHGFVHLHVHTEYSLLDGACRLTMKRDPTEKEIEEAISKGVDPKKARKTKTFHPLVDAAIAKGQNAIAVTDHGNMFAGYKFLNCVNGEHGINESRKEGEKFNAIIGCEVYLADDINKRSGKDDDDAGSGGNYTHLILLAKDLVGYHNLCKIVSKGYTDGFYYKPRVDLNIIEPLKEGLICLTGCIAGKVPRLLRANRYDDAKEFALKLKGLFGDDFYIELQNHELEDEKIVLPLLIKLAKEIGVKCVATNDIHYIEKEDSDMHNALVSIRSKSMAAGYKAKEYYMRTEEEMLERFSFCKEAVWNTVEVADKCHVVLPGKENLLPDYNCEEKTRLGMNSDEYLRYKTYEGLKMRYGDPIPQNVIDRAEEELRVVISMKFSNYFLVVWDFINWSKSHGIPVGPGRGSGVGSVVAYAMTITDVEPLQYGLIFERFLAEGRPDYPDFDIDFCCERRQEVIEYVCEKYGRDCTCRIATFGSLKAKQAFKDICRVYGISIADVNKICKYIPDKIERFEHVLHDHYDENGNLVNSHVQEIIDLYNNDETYKKIMDIVQKIDSMPRQPGMHAAGVIICCGPVSDYVPLAVNENASKGERNIITQYDKTEVEPIGLLKMDFLGLITLTDIHKACMYVKENYGVDLDFSKMGVNDPEVFKMIGEGKTEGVFQLEGGGMTKFMMDLKPSNIEDIIAGISMYRPGPMDHIPEFIQNKRDPSKIKYDTPELEHILKVTYGIIIYQEQAMQIATDLAGYTMKEANNFRKIISKKKADKMAEQRDKFVKGCLGNNISESIANVIFDKLESFCSYAFNKSHAAAYAYVGYRTAYLRRYYPAELYTGMLNDNLTNAPKIAKYIKTLKGVFDIPLLPPDINESKLEFSTDGKTVRYGLLGVKNVGKSAVECIIAERNQNGPYRSLSDFVMRANDYSIKNTGSTISRSLIESLIYGGAFDSFGYNRTTLNANLEDIIALEDKARKERESPQMSIFDMLSDGEQGPQPYTYTVWPENSQKDILKREKEVLGMFVTGNPLEEFKEAFEQFTFNSSMISDPEDDAPETEDDSQDSEKQSTDSAFTDNAIVTVGGMRNAAEVRRDKNGRTYCSFTLDDYYGTLDVMVYSSTYERYKNCLTDEILATNDMVKVKGRLSIREGEKTKIIASRIEVWNLTTPHNQTQSQLTPQENAIDKDHRAVCITIGENFSQGENLQNILRSHPGNMPVFISIGRPKYKFNETVGNIEVLMKELRALVGWENVKIIDVSSVN